jgi:hypothetical protein
MHNCEVVQVLGDVRRWTRRSGTVFWTTAATGDALYKDWSVLTPTMTSEDAAQLIDDTLDLVHQRLISLEHEQQTQAHKALAEEFREWRHPSGGHIDLMVCPGFPPS